MPMTRTSAVLRAKYGWQRKTVDFSLTSFKGKYKTGAAGYVAMCWGIPASPPVGGPNIVSLLTEGWAYEVPAEDLRPGDAVGYLGPDAIDADGGVIVIFEKWLNDDPSLKVALTWEHLPITSPGPDQRARPIDFRWHAYRFRDIVDG